MNPTQNDMFQDVKKAATDKAVVHFDGGAKAVVGVPCGYGACYGSFNIDGGKPYRLDHDLIASANVAEILTLCSALDELERQERMENTVIHIIGDSQIALKWVDVAVGKRRATKLKKTSEEFQKAVIKLREKVTRFAEVETEWRGRDYEVAVFGH